MRGQAGFFDIDERLKELSAKGDALERLNAIVDFEVFRPDLARAVPRSDGSKGGRPPFDLVFMWKTSELLPITESRPNANVGPASASRLSEQWSRALLLGQTIRPITALLG